MKVFKTTFFLLFLMLLAGCVSLKQSAHETYKYMLSYPAPESTSTQTLPVVLHVVPFFSAPEFRTTRMIYKRSEHDSSNYIYHSWRVKPEEMITHLLIRDFKASSRFKAIGDSSSLFTPTHILEGSVDMVYEDNSEARWHAVLGISVTLLDANQNDVTRNILFQKSYQVKKPCKKKNPEATAEAMSQALAEISDLLQNDIFSLLSTKTIAYGPTPDTF